MTGGHSGEVRVRVDAMVGVWGRFTIIVVIIRGRVNNEGVKLGLG